MNKTKFIVQSAVIAALYTVLTLIFAPISYGNDMIQIRISEALTVLPYFTPAAVPGLFVGCLVSNIFSPVGAIDIIVGSGATLIAAFLSYKTPRRFIVPLPPVIVNGLVIGAMLHFVFDFPLLLSISTVAVGQAISCYCLGYPLMLLLEKYRNIIFSLEKK